MVGVEYILLHAQEPILFIVRKQQRQSPTQGKMCKLLALFSFSPLFSLNTLVSWTDLIDCSEGDALLLRKPWHRSRSSTNRLAPGSLWTSIAWQARGQPLYGSTLFARVRGSLLLFSSLNTMVYILSCMCLIFSIWFCFGDPKTTYMFNDLLGGLSILSI